MPALSISATTISEAIESARAKPVVTMITPATAVAMNAYRSVSTCWKAPSTLRELRLALDMHQAAAMLTTIPISAVTSTSVPATSGGSNSRVIAS